MFCRSKSTARADLELGQVPRRVPVTPGPGLPCEDPGGHLLPGSSAHSPRCNHGQRLSVALPQPPRARLLRVVSYWRTSPSPGETVPWAPDAPGAKHALLSRPFPFSSLGLFSTCIQVSLNEKQPFPARRARSSFCKHHGIVAFPIHFRRAAGTYTSLSRAWSLVLVEKCCSRIATVPARATCPQPQNRATPEKQRMVATREA